jgi:site-specific recombinase XerD
MTPQPPKKERTMANHPGSITKRGPSYRIRLCVDGERHYFTLKGATKAEAEQFAREKDTELRRRTAKGLPGPMDLSELLDRYREVHVPEKAARTRETYRASLDAFESYFVKEGGDPKAHEIRPGHVRAFMHWRRHRNTDGSPRSEPLAARSVGKDRAVLHGVFAYAQELEVTQGNPVSVVKPPKGDSREPLILDEGQYERLLLACEGRPMLRVYVLTLGEAGLRCNSEALWLRWEDVDLERGFLTVESVRKGRRTKSGKSRKVPITPRLSRTLREHMASFRMQTYNGSRSPWVFHHRTTHRRAKAGDRVQRLYHSFKKAAERAELPDDLNQHDLRHRRVTTWLAAGKSPALVQKAMGHSDLKTTMAYAHLVSDDLLALVETEEDRQLRALADS